MTAFPEFLTDDVEFNATVSDLTGVAVALTDDVEFNDSTGIGYGVDAQDGVVFDDTATGLVITQFTATPSDQVGFDDSIVSGLGVGVVDDIEFGESTRVLPWDDIEFNDTPIAGLGVAVADDVTFDDVIGLVLGDPTTDDVAFNDTPTVLLSYGRAIIDDVSFDDIPTTLLAYNVTVTDDIQFIAALITSEFVRTVIPIQVSDLWHPGALSDMGITGLLQLRATKLVGWSWEEKWGPLSIRNADDQGLIAFIKKAWNRGTIFETTHALVPGSGMIPNGLGTAGILVKGASQTGEDLITDGWPSSTANCVRSGDVIKIAGDKEVYLVTEDKGSDSLGAVTIPITPPLRQSPLDNAAVATTGVVFRTTIMSYSQDERSRPAFQYEGMTVVFTEALS